MKDSVIGSFIGICSLDILNYIKDFPQANSKARALEQIVTAGGLAANAARVFKWFGSKQDSRR